MKKFNKKLCLATASIVGVFALALCVFGLGNFNQSANDNNMKNNKIPASLAEQNNNAGIVNSYTKSNNYFNANNFDSQNFYTDLNSEATAAED